MAYIATVLISLTITDPYGCSATTSQQIYVFNNNMKGELVANPQYLCQDDTASFTIDYESDDDMQPVQHLDWYVVLADGSHSLTPVASTYAPNLSYTTQTEGQYFAYAFNSNGCIEQADIKPTYVAYIPKPKAPKITGQTEVCFGSEVTFKVPKSDVLHYTWSLNGTAIPTAIDNNAQVTFVANTAGVQSISVFASIDSNEQSCNGEFATFEFLVLEDLPTPIIDISHVNCEPYQVKLKVSNLSDYPNNIQFNWSNGATDSSTVFTHDGPVQVTVGLNNCEKSSMSFNLPIDLTALDWTFPKGCYTSCEKEKLPLNTHIIGPLRVFEKWAWLGNNNYLVEGNQATVTDLNSLATDINYQLLLVNKSDCSKTYGDLAITHPEKCFECRIKADIINCRKVNGLFELRLAVASDFDPELHPVINLSVPNQEGFFIPSSINIDNYETEINVTFVPNNAIFDINNDFTVRVLGENDKYDCTKELVFNLSRCNLERAANKENALVLIPNPAKQQTKVVYSLLSNNNLSLEISNALGIVFYKQKLTTNFGTLDLDISYLTQGLYTVSILQNKTSMIHKKLIKQ